MIKRWIWDKTTECHILLLGDSTHIFYQLRSSALLEFHPLSDVSIRIGTVASRVFLSDQLCPYINSSDIKSRERVVSVIAITSVFWILRSMMTHTNQDEDEGADFVRKASNLDANRQEEVN